MSRRPADKAAQNQQVIKNLLKLETNKHCADCKRNKHPRWASWNLGVFICIRCSGIHRGMGTHISRVKSVDLDAWTDEQLQSIMKWGNARANRYWESKLAQGHVPSDSKIENFIRTKYESKRWIMDGPMPDPSSLGGDGDEDVPLTTVQEMVRLDRSASQRAASASRQLPARSIPAPQSSDSFNLIDGGDEIPVPPRASTTEPSAAARPPPSKASAQPSQLLQGLDFLSGTASRPSSASSGPSSMSRPDLKQSILSLYASKPVAQTATQSPAAHSRQASSALNQSSGGNDAFGGLNDAFGGLDFTSNKAAVSQPLPQSGPQVVAPKHAFTSAPKSQPAKPDAYAALTGVLSSPQASVTPMAVASPPPLSGGGFFDSGFKTSSKPAAQTTKPNEAPSLMTQTAMDDWGDFSIATENKVASPKPTATSNSTLLDFTSGAASSFTPPPVTGTSDVSNSSVFNLSSKPASTAPTKVPSVTRTNISDDPWGANEWSTPDPVSSSAAKAPAEKSGRPSNDFGWTAPRDWSTSTTNPVTKGPAFDTGGWGDSAQVASSTTDGASSLPSNAPRVQPEEDFAGGWGVPEATPARPQVQPPAPSNDDLFTNVWG